MCGIVGYSGHSQVAPILLDGLAKLEYRGYDSAGICVHSGSALQICKAKGRLQVLCEKTAQGRLLQGTVGIGHTRWATHGAPSDRNSHPISAQSGKVAVVHNGIIENEARLRAELQAQGICFQTDTDTEVVANLIDRAYAQCGDFTAAVRSATARLEGSYALGIMCADLPDTVVAVKMNSPLIFGYGQGEHFIASDVTAILKYTRTVSYLDDGEMAVFDAQSVQFYNAQGREISKEREQVTWEISAAERGGYDHFMMKEIMEQPKALRDTIRPHIRQGKVTLGTVELTAEYLRSLRKIYLVACGSAYYVSVLAKYTVEKACRIPTEAVLASEFRYGDPTVGPDDLVIVISQSGETADSLAAVKEAKSRGARTLAIVNVVGSAIAKAADQTIYTCAGPEIAVATTKAFSTQLAVVYMLALHIAGQLHTQDEETLRRQTEALECLPEAVESVLIPKNRAWLKDCAAHYCQHHDAFYIGRNLDSAVCLEGSLKLKEVAYLHSEAYPAGELKHGPISLIEDGTLVVALATIPGLFDKTMANIREVRARGADVFCVTLEGLAEDAGNQAQNVFAVPQVEPMLQPSLSLIPLQLFGYYMALARGCDVDKPRNLAKSVTVE